MRDEPELMIWGLMSFAVIAIFLVWFGLAPIDVNELSPPLENITCGTGSS